MKHVFSVKDMSCAHCVRHIENALSETESVLSFKVDLATKTVSAESELPAEIIAAAIREAGYTPVPA